MVYLLAQVWLLITSLTNATVTVPAQPSLVTTEAVFAAGTSDAQLTVTAAGQVMAGGVMSLTVTLRLQVAVLPHASVATYLRVYTTGHVPLLVSRPSCAIDGVPHASEAVGTGHEAVAGQSIVTLAAQVIVGAVMSLIVTVRLQVAVLPHASVAIYLRVYTTGQVPLEVSSPSCVIVAALHSSDPVGSGQEAVAGQSIVALAAQVIVGAVISLTVTLRLQVAVLPHASVAIYLRV